MVNSIHLNQGKEKATLLMNQAKHKPTNAKVLFKFFVVCFIYQILNP